MLNKQLNLQVMNTTVKIEKISDITLDSSECFLLTNLKINNTEFELKYDIRNKELCHNAKLVAVVEVLNLQSEIDEICEEFQPKLIDIDKMKKERQRQDRIEQYRKRYFVMKFDSIITDPILDTILKDVYLKLSATEVEAANQYFSDVSLKLSYKGESAYLHYSPKRWDGYNYVSTDKIFKLDFHKDVRYANIQKALESFKKKVDVEIEEKRQKQLNETKKLDVNTAKQNLIKSEFGLDTIVEDRWIQNKYNKNGGYTVTEMFCNINDKNNKVKIAVDVNDNTISKVFLGGLSLTIEQTNAILNTIK